MWSWPVTLSAMFAASLRPNTSSQLNKQLLCRIINLQHLKGSHLRWSRLGGGRQWSKLVSTLYHLKRKAGFWVCTHSTLPFSKPFFLPLLPSFKGIQRPDVSRSSSVPGDDDPFACSHPTHDVIHSCDDRDFGQTHHCILEVFSFFQRLHSYTRHESFNSSSGSTFTKEPVRNPRLDLALCLGHWSHKSAKHPPPSPTSWLEIAWRGRQTPRSSTSSTSVQSLQQVKKVITPPSYRVCRSEYVRQTQKLQLQLGCSK